MTAEDFKRKLTAVFSADVAGYSRLMGDDEASTVKTLETYKGVMFSLIKQHRGRVIDSPGDNLLAEFASVVDAVQCAVAVQKELLARNAHLPENRKMEFRIGINLGDVIEEQERIYGDGVNIAARLETLAPPGGICVSKTAFDHIESKLPLGYEYLGEHSVKNIARPVGAYRVVLDPRVTVVGADEKKAASRKTRLFLAIGVIVILLAGALASWQYFMKPTPPPVEKADLKKMAFPLPDKPSIAVLPFVNMSDDPKQEYLADGISENIISALSQLSDLLVIARNSTFSFKGKSVKVQQVAEELGVRYVLEGSVQRSGDSLRVTAQLIDATKGHHIWSERYDRELKKLFALQDEITIKVVNALALKLTRGEYVRLATKGTKNLQAYLKYLEAQQILLKMTREGNATARRLLEEVVALDPQFPRAYCALGGTYFLDLTLGIRSMPPAESLRQSQELMEKSIAMDDSDPLPHSNLGWVYVLRERKYDQAIAECERALSLAPNAATSHFWMGNILNFSGKHEEAIRYFQTALRLDPIPPNHYFSALGRAYLNLGRYEEAITFMKRTLERAPDHILAHQYLAATYSWAGRPEDARRHAAELLRINPNWVIPKAGSYALPYKNEADREKLLEGYRKAGLPDKPSGK